jgi:hypothetical protein
VAQLAAGNPGVQAHEAPKTAPIDMTASQLTSTAGDDEGRAMSSHIEVDQRPRLASCPAQIPQAGASTVHSGLPVQISVQLLPSSGVV